MTAKEAVHWLLSEDAPDWRTDDDRHRRKSLLALARASGVPERRLRRWKAGKSVRPENADDFADYGITMIPYSPQRAEERFDALERKVAALEEGLRKLSRRPPPRRQTKRPADSPEASRTA